jgi:hypothetical protein
VTIVCLSSENDPFVNHLMDYAQYESAAALFAVLERSPPDEPYCTIGNTVVTAFDVPGGFRAMCADRGGSFHQGAL